MKTLFCLLLLCSSSLGDFSSDAYPSSIDILPKLIAAAARSGQGLRPKIDPNHGHPMAYYMRSASYIGECKAPFGTIHILAISYTRSAPKDSRNPPRGHSFVLFFDKSLNLRGSWSVDFDSSKLSLRDGSKVYFGDELVFDYADLPEPIKFPDEDRAKPHANIDGQNFVIPRWDIKANTTESPTKSTPSHQPALLK